MTSTQESPATMANKISNTLNDILSRISDTEARAAREQEKLAELRREALWAEGEERRARLGEIRSDAESQLGDAANEGAEIAGLARDLAAAAVRLHQAGAARNSRLATLHARAVAEGVKNHGGTLPPSPADNGLGLLNGGIVVGRRRCNPVDTTRLVLRAIDAAADTARTGAALDDFTDAVARLDDELPALDPARRYWLNPETGGTFLFDQPSKDQLRGLVEITALDWLSREWGITVAELPADVRAQAEDGMPA